MKIKKSFLFVFFIFVILLVVSAVYFNLIKEKKPVNLETSQQNFESIKKQIKDSQNKFKNSKIADSWKESKFDQIINLFAESDKKKLRTEYLQNLIYLYSLPNSIKDADQAAFNKMLSTLGKNILNNKPIIYIEVRLFLNLVNQLKYSNSEIYELLKDFRKTIPDEKLNEMITESFMLAPQVEYAFKAIHINKIKQEVSTQQALAILDRYRDQKTKKEITQFIFDYSTKATSLQQSLFLKYLIFHRYDFKGDIGELIKIVSKDKNEIALDAFLSAVQYLNLQRLYKNELEWIKNNSQSIFLKQLASELLASSQLVGGP